VLNWKLNGLRIKNWGNSLFSGITSFFQGNTTANPLVPLNDRNMRIGPEQGHSKEWVLNQGISDIVIRDIEVGFGWIFPVFIREAYHKIARKFVLYFYLDELDEEFDEELRKNLIKRINFSSINPKLIEFKKSMNHQFSLSVISFRKSYRLLIARLKRILEGLNTESQVFFYASDQKTDHCKENNNEKIRGPDRAKLKFAFPFHKRN